MNNLDKKYQDLLQDIIDNGVTKSDRTGTGTISVFGRQIRHDMKTGFPLITTKKLHFKSIVVELLWFLRGDTNIKYLVDNNCHIWDGDAYKRYMNNWDKELPRIGPCTQEEFINKIKTDDEFAKKWGLTIEERELSLVEMIRMAKYENEEEIIKTRKENINQISERLLKDNIATRAISLTYNDKTIESYE